MVDSHLSSLEEYRAQIREKDKQLLALVSERFSLVHKIAEAKRIRGIPTVDPDAEQTVMSNLVQASKELEIDPSFSTKLGDLLIEESVKLQQTSDGQSRDQLMKEIFELTQKLVSQGKRVFRFEIGEPNFQPPPGVVGALTKSFRHKKIIGYGPAAGLLELRRALALELSEEHDVRIDPDQILITPGGRFGIFSTITSFVSQLERVVIPQPAWPAYEECVNFAKGRGIPVNSTLENDWVIDLGKIELELKKGARMIVINSPSNPTGKMIAQKEFGQLVELAQRHKAIVLSDEVYSKYTRSKSTSILEHETDNYVYINSFSKEFSLTGWRIAYLVTTKEKALRIRRIIQTAVTCVPEFIQRAALVAIKKGRREAQHNINNILNKVDVTCRELSKLPVSFYRPDGAFYVFPRANKEDFDSIKFSRQLLEDSHVSISPGQSFGNYPAFFRLAVSLPKAQIPSAIKRIGRAIENWS